MTSRPEILLFCCHPEDVEVLRGLVGTQGPVFHTVDSLVELAHLTVTRWPAAVFLGVGSQTASHLDVIRTLRTARSDLPIVVIGESDSLDLERRARQEKIFYYLIHPVDRAEVEAVLANLLRHGRA